MNITETIEILEDFKGVLEKNNALARARPDSPMVQALSHALAILKAYAEEKELPERRDDTEQDSLKKYFGDIQYDNGFNDIHDIAKPIIVRLKLRVEKKLQALEEKITEKNIDIIRNEFSQDLANSLKTGNKPKYRTLSIAIVTELKGGKYEPKNY